MTQPDITPIGQKTLTNKPDLSHIPLDLMEYVVRAFEYGMTKADPHPRDNWRLGFSTNQTLAAALRHIGEFKDHGYSWDSEALEHRQQVHHLAMAIFNLFAALNTCVYHPEMVDRPEWHKQ